ncbi:hypothetical protein NQZ68_011484 [Dissostichus eleginoides]|nr:hypothetical protein NQZ68_011484 [Dissostichus eleginoides]
MTGSEATEFGKMLQTREDFQILPPVTPVGLLLFVSGLNKEAEVNTTFPSSPKHMNHLKKSRSSAQFQKECQNLPPLHYPYRQPDLVENVQ